MSPYRWMLLPQKTAERWRARVWMRWVVAIAMLAFGASVVGAVALSSVAEATMRAVNGAGLGATGGGGLDAGPDPGCYPSDAGQLFYCTGYAQADGAGFINPAKVLNPNEWPATNSTFTNGCGEGCIVPDASFAPGDGFLHQIVRVNHNSQPGAGAPDAACFAYWPPSAGAYFVPPTDAAGPWAPSSCNPIEVGSTQSTQEFNNPDGGPWVFETSINNPNVVGLDNSLILYSDATFCPGLYHQACLWAKGYYATPPASIGQFWEIDLTIGIINLWEGATLEGSANYGSSIPGSCNPNVAPCKLDLVIVPGVSLQMWVNGVSMGSSGLITSVHVPSDKMYIQRGVEVAAPGPGTWSGIVDLKSGPDRVCAYIGVPHC